MILKKKKKRVDFLSRSSTMTKLGCFSFSQHSHKIILYNSPGAVLTDLAKRKSAGKICCFTTSVRERWRLGYFVSSGKPGPHPLKRSGPCGTCKFAFECHHLYSPTALFTALINSPDYSRFYITCKCQSESNAMS